MTIDTSRPGTAGWWMARLLKELGDRQPRLEWLNRYYEGDADLPEGAENCRQAFRVFQEKSRTNFAELVVEAVRERMQVTGFRTGAAGDDLGDSQAWSIWQANSLDADQMIVHRDMLSMGDAYAIVGGPDKEIGGAPVITPEDPRQVVTAHDPMRPRKVIAALKCFYDDVEGVDQVYLYLPGMVFRAQRNNPNQAGVSSFTTEGFEWLNGGDPKGLPRPVVPVVRFPNRPNKQRTWGEFETVRDVLDRINFGTLERLVITAVSAFKQRAIKGDLPANDPETGEPIDYSRMFQANPGALWQLPDGIDIWESSQTDMTSILNGSRHDVQDLAAVTRTPLFYLTPDAANGSAEGASLAREGLVFKVGDRITQTSDSWEQVMSLAFMFSQDTVRADRQDMEALWAPPERFTLAERYDAASKAGAAGVPWRTVMSSVLQFSPQEVERMEAERAVDSLLAPAPPAPSSPAQLSVVPPAEPVTAQV